jgi:hypothetical protein
VLLVRNDDGSETAAGVLQVDGDDAQTAGGIAVPRAAGWFNAPIAYAEGLASDARTSGDLAKARLEDWTEWIIDELGEIDGLRAVEVTMARHVADLYDREITLHPPEGFQSVNDDEVDDDDVLEGPRQNTWLVGRPPLTGVTDPPAVTPASAARTSEAHRWWDDLLEESRAHAEQPSRITILVPPMATPVHNDPDDPSSPEGNADGWSADGLLELVPEKRPDAFDALPPADRGLRGRIFLAMWADGYSEMTAWAVALARDVSGVTGPDGFLDVSNDGRLWSAVAARRAQRMAETTQPARTDDPVSDEDPQR